MGQNILITGKSVINSKKIEDMLLLFDNDLQMTICESDNLCSYSSQLKYDVIMYDCDDSLSLVTANIDHIKKTRLNNNTPILLSLENSNDKALLTVLNAGALDIIRKPLIPIEVFSRVRAALILSSSLQKFSSHSLLLNEQKEKSDELLRNIVPEEILSQFHRIEKAEPKKYDCASILFADMVDFTKKSAQLDAQLLISELTEIFSAFDGIIKQFKCIRLKTMGDGYMAVSGIPHVRKDHAEKLVDAAVEMRKYLNQRNLISPIKWEVRIGINSGDVIGSVLGKCNLLFDVFGEAVNVAARMEKSCEPNHINVAHTTYKLVRHRYEFVERLPNQVKGIGVKRMFYVKEGVRNRSYVVKNRLVDYTKVLKEIFS